MTLNLSEFFEEIGYSFQQDDLARLALTHSSTGKKQNNERLEFLGDAVLELVSSRYLFFKFPDDSEGSLTKRRARLVCEPSLAWWARGHGLGRFIRLGKSEEFSGGREKDSILSDMVESIIGAVYLDSDFATARQFTLSIIEDIETAFQANQIFYDAKSELQELLQKNGAVDFKYEIYRAEGPPHNTTFYARAILDGNILASGAGRSKKLAEQAAAKAALVRLKKNKS